MSLDSSNERYSNVIAGILVILVASIFLACILGGWDHNVFPQNDVKINHRDRNNIMENSQYQEILAGGDLLPIAEKCCKGGYTTEEGWIIFANLNIPDPLPLVIDQGVLDTWSLKAYAFGDYDFDGGEVEIYQWKDNMGSLGTLYLVQISLDDTKTLEDLNLDDDYPDLPADLTIDVYTIGFVMGDNNGDLLINAGDIGVPSSTYIELMSNQYPGLPDMPCCVWDENPILCPYGQDFFKLVKFKFKMDWSGCPQPDQAFEILLAYISMLRSPQLPIKNFIAS
jgi:hypothetical protein